MSEKTWGILLTTSIKMLVALFMVSLISIYIDSNFSLKVAKEAAKLEGEEFKNSILPNLFSSAVALFFLAHVASKVTEFAGAMANGHTIQSSNLVATAGAYVQNQMTGGLKAAANYAGRHTGAAAWKGIKDGASAAWTAATNRKATGRAIAGAASFAKNNPLEAAKAAGSAAGRYMGSLHRAGNKPNPMKEMKDQLDNIEKKVSGTPVRRMNKKVKRPTPKKN